MKYPVTFLLLLAFFQFSCNKQDKILSEIALDKMIGKWERISALEKTVQEDYEGYVEREDEYLYYEITIFNKETNNTGIWRKEEYNKADSLLERADSGREIKILDAGTRMEIIDNDNYLFEGFIDEIYGLAFEGDNLKLWYPDDNESYIWTYSKVE